MKFWCTRCVARRAFPAGRRSLDSRSRRLAGAGVDQAIVFSDSASTLTSTVPPSRSAATSSCRRRRARAAPHRIRSPPTRNSSTTIWRPGALPRASPQTTRSAGATRPRSGASSSPGLYRNCDVVPPRARRTQERVLPAHLGRVLVGVLGPTGRGVTEMFEIPIPRCPAARAARRGSARWSTRTSLSARQVDYVSPRPPHHRRRGRPTEVVDHQRLSGAGYCFRVRAALRFECGDGLAEAAQAGRPARGCSTRTARVGASKIHGLEVIRPALADVRRARAESSRRDGMRGRRENAHGPRRRCSDVVGAVIPTTKYMPSGAGAQPASAPLRPSLRCAVTASHTAEQGSTPQPGRPSVTSHTRRASASLD